MLEGFHFQLPAYTISELLENLAPVGHITLTWVKGDADGVMTERTDSPTCNLLIFFPTEQQHQLFFIAFIALPHCYVELRSGVELTKQKLQDMGWENSLTLRTWLLLISLGPAWKDYCHHSLGSTPLVHKLLFLYPGRHQKFEWDELETHLLKFYLIWPHFFRDEHPSTIHLPSDKQT